MLITFHYFALLVYELLKNRKRLKKIIENPVADHETQLKFHPPVFKQRLSKVYQTLIEEKWRNDLKKLVDFGCAEFDLFMYLKNLNIEEIMFVDIDETSLKENLGKLEPFLVDRLRRRSHPLEILVFRGSAVDPDYRLCKTDVVTAIELIEHLYPDTLEALPYNIFSFVKPKLVIITTPNADFNVVFGRPGLRHPDHKFEWTRQQFEDWATNITQQFTDYSVEFTGIGKLLNQPENIGHCSQGAIFIRKDLLNEKYISPIYARKCQCDNSSPCKGQTTECKLLCNCVCALCLPDFSVGICKYFSCNVEEFEAYRPMKTWPKLETPSDTEPKLELFSNVDNYCNDTLINPLYNIFYKLIMKIDYPYELDTRSETERLMETFKYRINNFTSFNNRFYNEKTGQCEIPLIDIMYGDICISNEEISNLLCEAGYKLEKCITPQTGEPELCIISIPHEMDDIENTSEETEEYPNNSLSDETSNIDHNIDPGNLSDWDETPHVSATASTIQPKPNPDPLFDSGYLNSPSPVDAVAQEETDDQFEEATSSFSVGDKKNAVPRPLPIIMTTTNYRKHDPHKNELDRYHNMAIEHRTHNFEEYHEAVPGPSCSLPKPKKLKPKFEMKLFKEPTIVDDAKSLANIIVQNSLNIIDEDDLEIVAQSPLEIMDFLQEEEPQEVLVPVVEAMENGDLANNNRDNEGNNLEHNQLEMEVDEGIDLLNDNLEEIIAPNNVNLQENNNDLQVEAPAEEFLPVEIVENEAAPLNDLESSSESLAEASREALFDENSEPDLLEDFDIMMPNDDPVCDRIRLIQTFGSGITLTRIGPLPEPPAAMEHEFPDWLLHLLGNHIPEESENGIETSRFTSYCYCQGDGLDPYSGVHPSVDEADDESESSGTISNNSQDFAEVDPGPSDMFDMSSLPEDASIGVSITEDKSFSHDTEAFIEDIIKLAEEEVSAILVDTNNKTPCGSLPGCSDSGQYNVPPTPNNSLSQDDASYSLPTIGSFSSWVHLKPKLEDEVASNKKDLD